MCKKTKNLLGVVLPVILVVLAVIVVPLTFILMGFCTAPQFGETYYGELKFMRKRLIDTKEKKIVMIGNSAVAFGIRPDLIEKEIPEYKAVNFGLYGAIGTKAMLDLSRSSIDDGDIVLIMPELLSQSMSDYFSAKDLWLAADSDFGMLPHIGKDDRPYMAGAYFGYVSQKYEYLSKGSKPSVSGVYKQASFNDENGSEVGYMTFVRPYNTMPGGYDPNTVFDYDVRLFTDRFADMLNDYCKYAASRGASVYYAFSPVNRLAVDNEVTADDIDEYCKYVREKLDFAVMGDPHEYIFDHEWFYDSNVHVNSAGMTVYTYRLVEDIKAVLGISTPTNIELPSKPSIPLAPVEDGDNSDADMFVYEQTDTEAHIVGLSEQGKERAVLTVPSTLNGKPVTRFTADTFAGNKTVNEIRFGNNINIIYDGAFDGCSRLTKLVLGKIEPSKCLVGTAMLNNAPNCRIYVDGALYDKYITHYNWGGYASVIVSMGAN